MKHVEFSLRLLFYSAEPLDELAHPQALANATSSVQRTALMTLPICIAVLGGDDGGPQRRWPGSSSQAASESD